MTPAQQYLNTHPAVDGLLFVVRSLLKASGYQEYSAADLTTLRTISETVAEVFAGLDSVAVDYYVNLLGREFKPKAT